MLPSEYRLKKNREFSEIFKRGKSYSCRHLIMKYLEEDGSEIKIGFSVGLKFSKKASERNKAKRWLREAARANMKQIKPGSKIVFVLSPKADFSDLSLHLAKSEMQELLRKGKLI